MREIVERVGSCCGTACAIIPAEGQTITGRSRRIERAQQSIRRGCEARHRRRTWVGTCDVAFQEVARRRHRTWGKAVHGIAKGINQVPTTLVGPSTIRQEAHTQRIAITHINSKAGGKTGIECKVGHAGARGDFQVVEHRARTITRPSIAKGVHQIQGVLTAVLAAKGGLRIGAEFGRNLANATRVKYVDIVGRAGEQARNNEGAIGRSDQRSRTRGKARRTVLDHRDSTATCRKGHLQARVAKRLYGDIARRQTWQRIVDSQVVNSDVAL